MPVLVNQYKKIQYLIDALVIPFLKTQHPKWRELILVYLKYLDENPLFAAINFTDNTNVNEMFSELLDDFLDLYFKDVVDLDKFGLNDDNKRLFIALSKLVHNLKATGTSFGFFFNSFTNFSIPTDTGDININDLVVELIEKPEWWLLNNDPTRPFTYIFKVNETDLTNLRELIREVHPSGWLQLFLYEVHFEEHFRGYDCLELTTRYGIFYNGKYNYDGIQMIDGVPEALLYQGEYVVEDFICAPDDAIGSSSPNYFAQQGDLVHQIVSDIEKQIVISSAPDIEFVTQSDIELPPPADSYDLSNQNAQQAVKQFGYDFVAQSFVGNGEKIIQVDLELDKFGTPPGNTEVWIMAHTGVFGTSSEPTAPILANSDLLVANNVMGVGNWTSFDFTGVDQITLTLGVNYCLVLKYQASNLDWLLLGYDNAGSHIGNFARFASGGWETWAAWDVCFQLWTQP